MKLVMRDYEIEYEKDGRRYTIIVRTDSFHDAKRICKELTGALMKNMKLVNVEDITTLGKEKAL